MLVKSGFVIRAESPELVDRRLQRIDVSMWLRSLCLMLPDLQRSMNLDGEGSILRVELKDVKTVR
jgi:hypothetical protein